jgi:hypothetical protein
VIGSAAVDISAQTQDSGGSWVSHSTLPGTVKLSLGGVGRNIAEAAHRVLASQGLPSATLLLSCLGDDAFGRLLAEETQRLGMRTDGLFQSATQTAVCNMILDGGGSLVGGVADMDIIKSLDSNMVCFNLFIPWTLELSNVLRLYNNCKSISQACLRWMVTCRQNCSSPSSNTVINVESTVCAPYA